jgi:hypothetical protein
MSRAGFLAGTVSYPWLWSKTRSRRCRCLAMRTAHRANNQEQAGGGRTPQAAGVWAGRRHLRSSIRLLLLAAAYASALLSFAVPAAAHGPCGCVKPAVATPGQQLVSSIPTIRIVWNPVRDDLLIGPDYLARNHVTGQPRVVLQDQLQPASATFRVPATAPGRYLVLLFDGTEDGMHYSWDYITVRSAPRSAPSAPPTAAATAPARRAGGLDGRVLVGVAALMLLVGAGVFVSARRRRTDGGRRAGRDGPGGR